MQRRIWLFLFLAAVCLRTQAQPDSLRTRNRFALGLAYTSGPRAYSSKGFAGPQVSYTFGKGLWEANAFVGGYYSYNEEAKNTAGGLANSITGIDRAYIIYRRTKGLQIQLGIAQEVARWKRLSAFIGIQGGWSVLRKYMWYKTVPEAQTNNFVYHEDHIRHQTHQSTLTPTVKVQYRLTSKLSCLVLGGLGLLHEVEDYSEYSTGYFSIGPYVPFAPDGSFDPFNPSRNTFQQGINSYSVNRPPLKKNLDILGYKLLSLSLNCNF